MAYSKKKHLQDNILAIQTIFRLNNENKEANEGDKIVLGKYSGFGGLKCILRSCDNEDDKAKWPLSEQELFDDTKLLYSVIRQHTRTDQEYKELCDSMRSSILSAFYTPTEVTSAIAKGLLHSGVRASNILDPSAGVGAFVGAFSDEAFVGPVSCYEKDILTANILAKLYPENIVFSQGFETINERSLNYFDIVTSNIPFGDYRVYDPLFSNSKDGVKKQCCKDIHSYFFIKAVDAAREGGLVAFITSQGVMNSPKNEYIRTWLMDKCRLISAIRLPDNLFTDSANTEAPSDLIILQKHSNKTEQNIREYNFTGIRQLAGIILKSNIIAKI